MQIFGDRESQAKEDRGMGTYNTAGIHSINRASSIDIV
jgi:hypothetical protein